MSDTSRCHIQANAFRMTGREGAAGVEVGGHSRGYVHRVALLGMTLPARPEGEADTGGVTEGHAS